MDFNGISHVLRQIQDGENQQEARSQLVILLEARGLVKAQVSSIVEYLSDLLNHKGTLENGIVDSFLDELSEDMSKSWTCPEEAQDCIKTSAQQHRRFTLDSFIRAGSAPPHTSATKITPDDIAEDTTARSMKSSSAVTPCAERANTDAVKDKGVHECGYGHLIADLTASRETDIAGPEDVTVGDVGFYDGSPAVVIKKFGDSMEIELLQHDEEHGLGLKLRSVRDRSVYIVQEDNICEFDDGKEGFAPLEVKYSAFKPKSGTFFDPLNKLKIDYSAAWLAAGTLLAESIENLRELDLAVTMDEQAKNFPNFAARLERMAKSKHARTEWGGSTTVGSQIDLASRISFNTRATEKRKADSGINDVRSDAYSQSRKRHRHGRDGKGKRSCNYCRNWGHDEEDCRKKMNALKEHNA